MSYNPLGQRCIGYLGSVNMNTTSDQPIPIDASRYIIRRIVVENSSANLTLAAGGMYTSASKAGTVVVAAVQIYTALTGSTKYLDLTLASAVLSDILTSATLYFSLTTAQGSAATARLAIWGDVLTP